jgi:nucleoside-diphosphate-sugar epimerase
MAKHFITGGCGYLGTFLSRELLQRNEEVVLYDIRNDPSRDPRATFIEGDVLDSKKLHEAMKGVDYVYHTAALVPLKKAGSQFYEVNVIGTKNVLQAAREAKVKHFVHISSSAVFGNITSQDLPIPENPTHLHPVESYGWTKYEAEQIVKDAIKHGDDLSCTILRPRTIIGPERLGIFQILFEWISEGKNIYIIGDGSNTFQFTSMEDLVRACIESCHKEYNGIINVGTDQYGTLREALENLCNKASTGSKVLGIPSPLAIGVLSVLDKINLMPLAPWHYLTYHLPYSLDINSFKNKLHLSPMYSNDEMLEHSYRWYLSHKNELQSKDFENHSPHRSPLKQGLLRVLKKLS